ncbi:hypothetical protein ZWY2020_032861 [Hordeum vulgare]|nr:hypothetical protein ZWY2020_032861 [Hordeum vulgare]
MAATSRLQGLLLRYANPTQIQSTPLNTQMAGSKGSSCAFNGCDAKVMSDERGQDILPCKDVRARGVLGAPSGAGEAEFGELGAEVAAEEDVAGLDVVVGQ